MKADITDLAKTSDAGLVPSLKETLFEPTIEGMGDAILEIAEIGLDAILQDGLLKDIPFFWDYCCTLQDGSKHSRT